MASQCSFSVKVAELKLFLVKSKKKKKKKEGSKNKLH